MLTLIRLGLSLPQAWAFRNCLCSVWVHTEMSMITIQWDLTLAPQKPSQLIGFTASGPAWFDPPLQAILLFFAAKIVDLSPT